MKISKVWNSLRKKEQEKIVVSKELRKDLDTFKQEWEGETKIILICNSVKIMIKLMTKVISNALEKQTFLKCHKHFCISLEWWKW